MDAQEVLAVLGERLNFWIGTKMNEPIAESYVSGGTGAGASYRYRGAILIDGIESKAKYAPIDIFNRLRRYRWMRLGYAKDRWIAILAEQYRDSEPESWAAKEILEVTKGEPVDRLLNWFALDDIVLAACVFGAH